ncbi:MAG: DUF4162 domain-containing protein, partial [Bacteroidales bacterium]
CDHIALINNGQTILHGNIDEIRSRFKPDHYELTYRGDTEQLANSLNSAVNMIVQPNRGNIEHVILKNQTGISIREMINRINSAVEIVSFEEMIPGMNEIFIRAVEETNHRTKSN